MGFIDLNKRISSCIKIWFSARISYSVSWVFDNRNLDLAYQSSYLSFCLSELLSKGVLVILKKS